MAYLYYQIIKFDLRLPHCYLCNIPKLTFPIIHILIPEFICVKSKNTRNKSYNLTNFLFKLGLKDNDESMTEENAKARILKLCDI